MPNSKSPVKVTKNAQESAPKKDGAQKVKLLLLMDMLRKETDKETSLSASKIIDFLASKGISCDRKTLSRDIEDLEKWGYKLDYRFEGHEKTYYDGQAKNLSTGEIGVLIDVLRSVNFLPENQTEEMVGRLKELGGPGIRKLIKNSSDVIANFNSRKRGNAQIMASMLAIREAIAKGKKLAFNLFKLDAKGEKVCVKETFVVDPVALVVCNDRCYLIYMKLGERDFWQCRLDRMDKVSVHKKAICPEAVMRRKDVPAYMTRTFNMYSGKKETFSLYFLGDNDHLWVMEAIRDQFGAGAGIKETGEPGIYSITEDIGVGPTFYAWLAQFQGLVWIDKESIRNDYRRYLEGLLKNILGPG